MKKFAKIYGNRDLKTVVISGDYNSRIRDIKDGHLTCFCDHQVNQLGIDPEKQYDVFGTSSAICLRWSHITGSFSAVASNSVKYILVILNLLMRIVFQIIGEHMGFRNENKKFTFVKTTIFWTVFF